MRTLVVGLRHLEASRLRAGEFALDDSLCIVAVSGWDVLLSHTSTFYT